MTALPVAPPPIPALADRGGTQLKTPRSVLLVDTREQQPFDFSRFQHWFAGVETRALHLGDYSIAGMEDVCVVERKNLSDLVHSLTAERSVFIDRLHHGTLSASTARDLRRAEPGEISLLLYPN